MRAVIELREYLWAVAKSAITEQEPAPSGREIAAMILGESVSRDRDSENVCRSMPPGAGDLGAAARMAIRLREDEALVAAIIPAHAREHSRVAIIGNGNLDVRTGAILRPSGCIVS